MAIRTLTPLLFLPLVGAGVRDTVSEDRTAIRPDWNGEHGVEIDPFGAFGDGWIYVYFPGFGTFSLADSTTEGSFAHDLFVAFGGSFEGFESVLMKTNSPSDINGGVIVFMPRLDSGSCVADFNLDGSVDLFDLFQFLDAFDSDGADADLDQNGAIDIFDLLRFLGAYSTGC
ncbi:MAG: hypothetical protein KC996_03075 [Phycisphaerales bacterium]|nr:hypothetical protein [Phycisphaerales bacterium]